MDDKNKSKDPFEPESHSAFSRKDKPAPSTEGQSPIPSQPRSFSGFRPQRPSPVRKDLATPSPAAGTPEAKPASPAPESPAPVPASSQPTAPEKPLKDTGSSADPESSKPAEPAPSESPATGEAAPPAKQPPQSSGAGGDTIRLRVQPSPKARTLNTSPGRGLRRRLPDIRQGKAASSSARYGPFSMLFGFLWLVLLMILFTGLVLGLGALIGFVSMTEYIKTPEVIVPEVSGMKIDEAFEALSDKELGIIRLRKESSALVAPGEIVSQQPPAGSKAKVRTDVGVVISSGRSQYEVPNVVNETLETAKNKILGARLQVGSVLQQPNGSVAKGNVIAQEPIGGQGRDEPVEVNLFISSGPEAKSLSMPDLSGRTILEAKIALKALGIDNVSVDPTSAKDTDKVQSQTPLVGKTVFQTDQVTLLTRR